MSNESIHINPAEIPARHMSEHPEYEYFRRALVPNELAAQCRASLYELPPQKSSYPYHYHAMNEEMFYIISGRGIIRTPGGEREVKPGDFLFFPRGEGGAHKITNTSQTQPLVYLDFDTRNEIDVAFYPDSGKIGVWGMDINQIYKTETQVEYYDGEA